MTKDKCVSVSGHMSQRNYNICLPPQPSPQGCAMPIMMPLQVFILATSFQMISFCNQNIINYVCLICQQKVAAAGCIYFTGYDLCGVVYQCHNDHNHVQ